MGNSNSSSVQVGHHPIQTKWTSIDQSLHDASADHHHHRNRMKKSYFPPNHYLAQPPPRTPHQHPLLVQPQHLVLPEKVNPSDLRLKSTSNGKILHGGGTISGRKLNELDLSTGTANSSASSSLVRKKSGGSSISPSIQSGSLDRSRGISTGTSTPNLTSLNYNDGGSSRQPKSKSRRESDPEFKQRRYEAELEERSQQQQPNSLISESPTKKQIRCRKKSNAPMPPLNEQANSNKTKLVGDGIVLTKPTDAPPRASALLPVESHENKHDNYAKKRMNRMFKTKDEQQIKQLNGGTKVAEDNCGKWEQCHVMKGRGGEQSTKQKRAPISNIVIAPPHEQQPYDDDLDLCSNNRKERTTILAIKNKAAATPLSSSSKSKSGKNEAAAAMSSRHDHEQQVISGRASLPIKSSSSSRSNQKTESYKSDDDDEDEELLPENQEVQKRTFYFGMEEDSTNTMRIRCSGSSKRDNNHNAANDVYSSSLTRSTNRTNNPTSKDKGTSSLQKSNVVKHTTTSSDSKSDKIVNHNSASTRPPSSRSDLIGKVIEKSSSSSHVKSERLGSNHTSQGSGANEGDRNQDKNFTANKMGQRSSVQNPSSSSSSNKIHGQRLLVHKPLQASRSGSDSDGLHYRQDSGTFDDFSEQSKGKHGLAHGAIRESSSSDLSSSEMDIPILLRPTLPQKRHELPRFSPASAWRALDSPPGRSLSSEEGFDGGIRYNASRPVAPSRNAAALNERSGDSGISAGDSPAIPDIVIPISINTTGSKKEMKAANKCWTPEQDLDESSSEYDENELIALAKAVSQQDLQQMKLNTSSSTKQKQQTTVVNSNGGSRTPPKLTTKKHFFSSKSSAMNPSQESDSATQQFIVASDNNRKQQHYNTKGEPASIVVVTSSNNLSDQVADFETSASKPSLRRIYHQRHQQHHNNRRGRRAVGGGSDNDGGSSSGGGGLGANWFLSRSEPNSLNNLRMMTAGVGGAAAAGGGPVDFILHAKDAGRGQADGGYSDDDEDDDDNFGTRSLGEFHSGDIGYGPSSLPYYHSSHNGRPFAQHIIYLPSYDSRRFYQSAPSASHKKARSVDNLDSMNVLYKPSMKNQRDMSKYGHNVVVESPLSYDVPVPDAANFAEQHKRKKFKFQSTLRVLERKQIERQLAQEANEQERERLREIEAMKEVEAEFQKKRAKEKELENKGKEVVTIGPWEDTHSSPKRVFTDSHSPAKSSPAHGQPSASAGQLNSGGQNGNVTTYMSGGTTVLSIVNNNAKQLLSNKSSSSSNTSSNLNAKGNRVVSSVNMNQRQEPEGAASAIDLRRELIHASRRRNGTNSSLSSSTDPLSTQELSEYRQETRQYWDYCRKPPQQARNQTQKQHASSVVISHSSRHGDSSSDVYPVSSRASSHLTRNGGGRYHHRSPAATYQHPEVVCEIPGKSLSQSSRLSGSASNLLDDRSSLLGGESGPSSVISDNYRRDWAHKHSGGGGGSGSSIIHIVGNGMNPSKRTSSIQSLHSAPGYSSSIIDNHHFSGQSNTDFSLNNGGFDQPHTQSLLISGPESQANSSRSQLDHSNVIFQTKPFGSNKPKEFRPVVFKPQIQMNSLS